MKVSLPILYHFALFTVSEREAPLASVGVHEVVDTVSVRLADVSAGAVTVIVPPPCETLRPPPPTIVREPTKPFKDATAAPEENCAQLIALVPIVVTVELTDHPPACVLPAVTRTKVPKPISLALPVPGVLASLVRVSTYGVVPVPTVVTV